MVSVSESTAFVTSGSSISASPGISVVASVVWSASVVPSVVWPASVVPSCFAVVVLSCFEVVVPSCFAVVVLSCFEVVVSSALVVGSSFFVVSPGFAVVTSSLVVSEGFVVGSSLVVSEDFVVVSSLVVSEGFVVGFAVVGFTSVVGSVCDVFFATTTVHTAFFLPSIVIAVIFAVPTFTAFTFPLLLTVATLGLLDLNVTTLAAWLGFTFVLRVNVLPGFNTFFFTLRDTLFTDFLATYTVTVCFAPLATPFLPFTVILAVPAFLALTTPFFSTTATLFLLEVNVRLVAFTASDILKLFFLSSGMTTLSSIVFLTRFFTATFTFLVTFLFEAEVTVIVACPSVKAFMFPLLVTFNTAGLLLS